MYIDLKKDQLQGKWCQKYYFIKSREKHEVINYLHTSFQFSFNLFSLYKALSLLSSRSIHNVMTLRQLTKL